jgi:hypothetical protein
MGDTIVGSKTMSHPWKCRMIVVSLCARERMILAWRVGGWNVWRDNIVDHTPKSWFSPNPAYPNDIPQKDECTTIPRAVEVVQVGLEMIASIQWL